MNLPPLNFTATSGARSDLNSAGSMFSASGAGDWIVNQGGSGFSLQSASTQSLLMIALAVGAVWLILKK